MSGRFDVNPALAKNFGIPAFVQSAMRSTSGKLPIEEQFDTWNVIPVIP